MIHRGGRTTSFTPSRSSPHTQIIWGGVRLPSSLISICCCTYVLKPRWHWIKVWYNHAGISVHIQVDSTSKCNALRKYINALSDTQQFRVQEPSPLFALQHGETSQYRFAVLGPIWSSVPDRDHLSRGQRRECFLRHQCGFCTRVKKNGDRPPEA